jgi:hypothetical protein
LGALLRVVDPVVDDVVGDRDGCIWVLSDRVHRMLL